MRKCNLFITNDDIAKAIQIKVGNNGTLIARYKTVYEDENGIKDSFKKLYFDKAR